MNSILITSIHSVKLWPNQGQITGLPANPRFIRDERYVKLVKSIEDHPEMLQIRECVVVPYLDEFVVIAGNMRLRAVNEVIAKDDEEFAALCNSKKDLPYYKEWLKCITELRKTKLITCKVLNKNTPVEQLKAYTIKDNVSFGSNDYDLLANEWDQTELIDWGMEMVDFGPEEEEDESAKEKSSFVKIVIEFEGDLSDFDEVKRRVRDIIEEFPDAKIRE